MPKARPASEESRSTLCWALSEITWYTQPDVLYFTTSFWRKFELIIGLLAPDELDDEDVFYKWVRLVTFFLQCFLNVMAFSICFFIAQLAVASIARSGTGIDPKEAHAATTGGPYIGNHWVDHLLFNLRFPSSLSLLEYPVHDVLFYLLTKLLGRGWVWQFYIQVVLSVCLSPLHALFSYGTAIREAFHVPKYIRLAQSLAWSAGLASAARATAILITLACLRRATESGQQRLAIASCIVGTAMPWIVLVVPAETTLYIAELSLIPEEVKTISSIPKVDPSLTGWESANSAALAWRSWQQVTRYQLKVVLLQLIWQAVVALGINVPADQGLEKAGTTLPVDVRQKSG